MVSVLVPIYNTNVCAFVAQLSNVIQKENIPAEIICIDDCSSNEYKIQNAEIGSIEYVVYEQLNENIGRSKIRNRLAQKAKYDWLLFVDCDSALVNDNFLSVYVKAIKDEAIAIYGGTAYTAKTVTKEYYLHWFYGTNRECVPLAQRKKNPYGTFKTNNFFIRKTVFEKVRFNEEIKSYGHEDTLFAKDLDRQMVMLLHIDNPLMHCGLETTPVFLAKQKQAIQNLALIYKQGLVGDEIRLIRFYNRVKKWRLMFMVKWLYLKDEKKLLDNLHSNNPKLTCLDRLKLGWFINEMGQ